MKYFKNTELAKLYNVSEKAVRNWIEAAKQGKIDLQLNTEAGRAHIANTNKNVALIEELVIKGKKYRNARSYKQVTPKPDFYKVYDSKEIFDILRSLDAYREIPNQYSYYNGGATDWDLYTQKLAKEEKPNLLTNTIHLLEDTSGYVENLVEDFAGVNIVDLGVGNGMPVRNFVDYFASRGRLNRYLGVDISQDMIDIATHNFSEWFDKKVHFESHVRDITYEHFEDLLATDAFSSNASVANLILFLGSTLPNFRAPNRVLDTIHESMGKNDLFMFAMKPDTAASRRYFDFGADGESISLGLQDRLVLDLLGIDEEFYDVEQFFDQTKMERRIQIRLNIALSIELELDGHPRTLYFNKDETILLWRHKQLADMQIINLFDASGFELLQVTRSKDRECLLLIASIKQDSTD